MPICSPNKQECVDKAINIVEQTAFDTSGKFLIYFQNVRYIIKLTLRIFEQVSSKLSHEYCHSQILMYHIKGKILIGSLKFFKKH